MPIVKDATQAPAVADKFDTLLENLASISGRPEIVNVPIVQTGLSAKGAVAYWLAKQRSWKTIALIVYHQSLYRDFALSALDLASPFNVAKIPSLYLAGGLDNLVPPARLHRSIQRLRALNFPVKRRGVTGSCKDKLGHLDCITSQRNTATASHAEHHTDRKQYSNQSLPNLILKNFSLHSTGLA